MPLTIYHNPRCSKSRATLALLEEAGAAPRVVPYLDAPPPAARILELASLLGIPVRELLRTGEAEVADADDLPDPADDAALAEWISRHPRALQRPIVVDDDAGRACIGRPPENVRDLLP